MHHNINELLEDFFVWMMMTMTTDTRCNFLFHVRARTSKTSSTKIHNAIIEQYEKPWTICVCSAYHWHTLSRSHHARVLCVFWENRHTQIEIEIDNNDVILPLSICLFNAWMMMAIRISLIRYTMSQTLLYYSVFFCYFPFRIILRINCIHKQHDLDAKVIFRWKMKNRTFRLHLELLCNFN